MIRIVGIGAGGHAKVVVELFRAIGGFEIIGLLDPSRDLVGAAVVGVPVLGDDSLLEKLAASGVSHAFIGVGGASSAEPRRRLFELVRRYGFELPTAVHPSAMVSPSAIVGASVTVMAAAVVNAEARLGMNALINTGAIVEHDCSIGSHVHVATGARLAGLVTVGDGAHIGIGATVRQGITIGRNAVVGAGSVVIDDVPESVVVAGVPAQILRRGP